MPLLAVRSRKPGKAPQNLRRRSWQPSPVRRRPRRPPLRWLPWRRLLHLLLRRQLLPPQPRLRSHRRRTCLPLPPVLRRLLLRRLLLRRLLLRRLLLRRLRRLRRLLPGPPQPGCLVPGPPQPRFQGPGPPQPRFQGPGAPLRRLPLRKRLPPQHLRHVRVAATRPAPRPVPELPVPATTPSRQARACPEVAATSVRAATPRRLRVRATIRSLPARACLARRVAVRPLLVPAVLGPAPRVRTRA